MLIYKFLVIIFLDYSAKSKGTAQSLEEEGRKRRKANSSARQIQSKHWNKWGYRQPHEC